MERKIDYYDIFRGSNGEWYWNLHNGGNHSIIATGGEGFMSRRNAHDGIIQFRDTVKTAYLPSAYDLPSMATADIIEDIDTEDRTIRKEEDERTDN